MSDFLQIVNRYICGIPVLILIVGTGLYLTYRTGFVQFRLFPRAYRAFAAQLFAKREGESGTSPYQALCTALAATVGTGNLAGVAGAIAIGGPGAIFWMWIFGILGMATKYAEATLAVRFRRHIGKNECVGGPMYMIETGLKGKGRFLAVMYCLFGVAASFGVGNATQINAAVSGINCVFTAYQGKQTQIGNLLMGITFAFLIAIMLSGGLKKIGTITENLVPVASVFYILLCIGGLIICRDRIWDAFVRICVGAFSPSSVTGGMVASLITVLRVGAMRGVFTNEAGLGTASIAHAAANVKHPTQQGLMGIMEVFLDTIVICTLTALVILSSGLDIVFGNDTGMTLTNAAFVHVYGDWVCIPLAIALCLFAVATVLGWSLYGCRCAQYLFGEKSWKVLVVLQVITVVVGACMQTETVWSLSEIANGMMAIPNLAALVLLTPELVRLTQQTRIHEV